MKNKNNIKKKKKKKKYLFQINNGDIYFDAIIFGHLF